MKNILYVIIAVIILLSILGIGYCYYKKNALPNNVIIDSGEVKNLKLIIANQDSKIINLSKLNKNDSLTIANLKSIIDNLNIKLKDLTTKTNINIVTKDSNVIKVYYDTTKVFRYTDVYDTITTTVFNDTTKHLILNGKILNDTLIYKYTYFANYQLITQKTRKNIFSKYQYKNSLLTDDHNAIVNLESVNFNYDKPTFSLGLESGINSINYSPYLGLYTQYSKNNWFLNLNAAYIYNEKKFKPAFGLTVKKQLIIF